MQRQLTFGGGVAPETTRFRRQSIIEYVLIIAVIGWSSCSRDPAWPEPSETSPTWSATR